MNVRDLREKYLRFFESKGHRRFPSGSLIPYDVTGRLDESLLFNGAGMIQFKPYFRGVARPDHPRLATCQKCVRTGDIEEVGDDTHLTFFEMLGNFSFGGYFKEEAIRYSWEFLTSPEWLALDPTRLSFTVFETDDLAEAIWRSCGAHHVVRLGEETNYWPAGSLSKGPPGLCGPNSEMFYWTPTDEAPPTEGYSRDEWERDESAGKWVEIWNDVFIQYEWQGDPNPDGKGYVKTGMPDLPFRSIDTGMGLERTAMVLGGKKSVYDTDAFTSILKAVVGSSRSHVSGTVSVPSAPEVVKRKGKHLPHWTQEGATYFVTFRLADAVPASKQREWQSERARYEEMESEGKLTESERHEFRRLLRDEVNLYLDRGEGECLLRGPDAARLVEGALRHFDGDRYDLQAWAVMPNHVHVVVRPTGENTLDKILHSWKSFTSHKINEALGRSGDVWMDESYDHLIRDENDWERCLRYTVENPAKSGLIEWPFLGRAEADGTETVPDTGDRDDPTTARRVIAARIVADHARTATFCVADGVLPSNNGRGYVLRRLIRRAVLRGSRDLGAAEDFFSQIAETVVEEYGGFYGELRDQQSVILETLKNEESLFRRTLSRGEDWLEDTLEHLLVNATRDFTRAIRKDPSWDLSMSRELRRFYDLEPSSGEEMDDESWVAYNNELNEIYRTVGRNALLQEMNRLAQTLPPHLIEEATPTLDGHEAFRLYDTFGFPIEVTQELANESGVAVDMIGYERAMKEAQTRSRGATEMETVYGNVSGDAEALSDAPPTTGFLGYDQTSTLARVVRKRKQGEKISVALDETPFYAESGGQTGDTGWLKPTDGSPKVAVKDTKKSGGIWWHEVESDLPLGTEVVAKVDVARRHRIQRHHTATHLLHLALREALGSHATQAGSYVGPDRLRFDFTHGKALTEEERARIEARVNELALANAPVTTHVDITPDQAKALGAMALFGEKYGDRVRMVEVGPSKELCGGIHVRSAAEIGPFRIVSEGSAQSGVRRIEAVAGEAAQEMGDEDRRILRQLSDRLKTQPAALMTALERTLDQLKEERRKREKAESSSSQPSAETSTDVKGVTLVTMDLGEIDPKTASRRVDEIAAGKPHQVTLSAVQADGKVQFTAKVGAEAMAKGAHAGNLLREVARIAGGGGGGRPDFATAGGKDASKIGEALAAAAAALNGQIG